MRCRSSLTPILATGLLAVSILGCAEGGAITGSGGTSESGGTPETGGQVGSGGTPESGGQVGTGGAPGTGGKVGTGGTPGTGGQVGTGGAPGSSGETGAGGSMASLGGATGRAGRTGTTSRAGGATSPGGSPGVGGAPSAGGSTGAPFSHKKFFGNIDTSGSIRSDFNTMWDQFSPENAGKWGSVQGSSQSSFNWGSLDRMYKYCTDNNIIFKEHCFSWGAQQPSWADASNGEAALKNWMTQFCQRYPKVAVIDVVNEPLHTTPRYRDGIGGTGASGWDWIVNALKWAKEACPNAVLIVNEYNTIEYSGENGRIISLAKAVKGAGAPLMALGAQAHDVAKVSSATLKNYAEKIIAETGLPLYITEMDIGVADDNQQAQMMRDFVTPLWANDKVPGFTYWGYIVGRTWRANTGLMTDSGTKRPALTWLMSFLNR